MDKYISIRVSLEDKAKLKKIAKLLGVKSLTEALRFALRVAEKELEKQEGSLDTVFSSLKYARDVGLTNAEDVDKYLYGES